MTFFDEWIEARKYEADKSFIKAFLDSDAKSLKVFETGSLEEIVKAVKLLTSIPISSFVYEIDGSFNFCSRDVVQFSNFTHAVRNTCRILEYDENNLSFIKLGELLYHPKTESAKRKYGENHSKLAEVFSLVKIEGKTNCVINNTAFGSFSISISDVQLFEVLKRLGLRNSFNKELISCAKKGPVEYYSVAKRAIKSDDTILRRKSNVKQLLLFCIEEESDILSNIIW